MREGARGPPLCYLRWGPPCGTEQVTGALLQMALSAARAHRITEHVDGSNKCMTPSGNRRCPSTLVGSALAELLA